MTAAAWRREDSRATGSALAGSARSLWKASQRLEHAPASYVLAHTPQQLLEHAQLVEPSPRNGQWRVAIQPGLKADEWHINIASRDRSGLLARLSGALSSLELNVINADIATWPDGAVLDIFTVRSMHQPLAWLTNDQVLLLGVENHHWYCREQAAM